MGMTRFCLQSVCNVILPRCTRPPCMTDMQNVQTPPASSPRSSFPRLAWHTRGSVGRRVTCSPFESLNNFSDLFGG